MRSHFLVAVVATVGSLASSADAEESEGLYRKGRLELSVGENLGSYAVGPLSGFAFGGTIQARHGLGALHLVLEGGFYGMAMRKNVTDETSYGARLTRIGAAAEYHFVTFGEKSVGLDLFVSGGVGRQMLWWTQGGKLERQDVALGFGLRGLFKVGGSNEKPKVVVVETGVRGLVADAPDLGAPSRCSAICDEGSKPFPYDVSVLWGLSVGYGW